MRRARQKPDEELCEEHFEERYREEITEEFLARGSRLSLSQEMTRVAERIESAKREIPWGDPPAAPASAWKNLTVAANRLRHLAEKS